MLVSSGPPTLRKEQADRKSHYFQLRLSFVMEDSM